MAYVQKVKCMLRVLPGGLVSNGPIISGTHHGSQTIIKYWYNNSVSYGPCNRDGHRESTNICLCVRVVPFLTARSSREPTTIAKRLFNMIIPFLTAPAIEDKTITTTNRKTICECCRVVPFPAARSYWKPTAEAKRLLSVLIPFLTAHTIEKITANRPLLCPLPLRLPIHRGKSMLVCGRVGEKRKG